jgi:membrane fusion protein (multidrug efflux system)
VFKVVDGKVVRVKVETGQRRDSMVEVVSGLTTGDMVVTAGQLKIRDGAAVRIAGADNAKGAPAAQASPPPAAPAPGAAAAGDAPVKAENAPARPKS